MKEFVHLLTENNKKSIILFIILNIFRLPDLIITIHSIKPTLSNSFFKNIIIYFQRLLFILVILLLNFFPVKIVVHSHNHKQKISKIVDEKAKGGRVGLKAGTNPFKRKTNIDKIKETFAPKKRVNAKGGKLIGGQKNIDVAAPFGKITGADFKKLRNK